MKPIIEKEHRVFGKTFLGHVIVQIHHDAKFAADDFIICKSFFEDNYGLVLDDELYTLLEYKTLRFSDNTKNFNVKMSEGFIQISMDGNVYLSFRDSLLTHVMNFTGLIHSLGFKIKKFSIEKINVFPAELQSRESHVDAIKDIFSSNLLEMLPEEYNPDIYKKGFKVDEARFNGVLFLSFGWMRDKEAPLKFAIILDSEAICENNDGIPSDDIDNLLTNMNQSLFDLYHWSVSDKVIKMMQ